MGRPNFKTASNNLIAFVSTLIVGLILLSITIYYQIYSDKQSSEAMDKRIDLSLNKLINSLSPPGHPERGKGVDPKNVMDVNRELKAVRDVNQTNGNSNIVHTLPNSERLLEDNRLALKSEQLPTFEPAHPVTFDPNTYINKSSSKSDVAILIVDEEGRIDNPLASRIAEIYREQKLVVTTSLFKTSIIRTSYLEEVVQGNSSVIEQLTLPSNTNFVVIGRISYKFDIGTKQKYISRPKLDISIISCSSKTQIDSFTLSEPYPSNFEDAAKAHAITKVLDKYKSEHSKIQ